MGGRSRLSALRRKALEAKKRTDVAREDSKKKRESRKAKPLALQNQSSEPRKRRINSTDVERWFLSGIRSLYGDKFIIPKWSVKQRTLAKKLIDIYGPELVEKAVRYLCGNWDSIVEKSRGSLSGAPTVNLLWGMKERVFADVQAPRKPGKGSRRDADEYSDEEDAPTVGW
jgi:hypothetical protein